MPAKLPGSAPRSGRSRVRVDDGEQQLAAPRRARRCARPRRALLGAVVGVREAHEAPEALLHVVALDASCPACRPSTSIAQRRSDGTPAHSSRAVDAPPIVGRGARAAAGARRADPGSSRRTSSPSGSTPGRASAASTKRNATVRPDGGSCDAAMSAPITCGAGGPWRSSSRTGRSEPALDVGAGDAVAGEVEAVGVGLEPVAQRDARHGEAVARRVDEAAERVELLLVEAGHVLGDDRAEQHAAERGAARGQVAVVDRDPARRHVPPRVPDVQLGEQHGRGPPPAVRRSASGAGSSAEMASQIASMIALKRGARPHGRGDQRRRRGGSSRRCRPASPAPR